MAASSPARFDAIIEGLAAERGAMTRICYVPQRCRGPFGRRRPSGARPSPPKPSGAASTSTIIRTGSRGPSLARAAGRGRNREGPRRLWPGGTGRCRGPVRQRVSRWRRASARSRPDRGDPLSQAAGEADLCALRRRSIRSRSTTMSPMAALPGSSARSPLQPAEIVKEVTESGLRGRGGAGFPTGIKWKTVLEASGRPEIHLLQCR